MDKIFDFRGRSLRYGGGGVLFKFIIKGRLKTVIAGLSSRNPCFQTTSVMSGRSSVGFAREKYIGLFCLGRVAKYPDFRGRSPCCGWGARFIQIHNKRSSENADSEFF